MNTKLLRVFILLFTLHFVRQTGQAAPERAPSMDVPIPTTTAMQAALAQSSTKHSDAPLLALLATVPKSEQATLALNLFLATTDDLEARRRVGMMIFRDSSSGREINRRHLLLLTQAYLQTVEHPLKWPAEGLDGGRTFTDNLFQRWTRQILSDYLGVRRSPGDWSPDTTPLDKLRRVFADAEKAQPDSTTAARIQACKNLLPP